MKLLLFSIACTVAGVLLVPASRAEDPTRWGLPEGALARLGKGSLSRGAGVAFSPDGTRLAVTGSIGIWLYDARTGDEVALLTGHKLHPVTSVSFSPDGQTLAGGSVDGTVRLWDVAKGQEQAVLEGHPEWVHSVAFSPDGLTLASGNGGFSGDYAVRLWDVASRTEQAVLEGHTDQVRSVSFSPDGLTLASGSADYTVRLWDVASRREKATLEGHKQSVFSVAFSSDGLTLASGSRDETVRLWEVASGQQKATLGHTHWVTSVAFSPDGETLASGIPGRVHLWDVASRRERATLDVGYTGVFNMSVAFSPDGQTLVSGDPNGVRLWDVASGQQKAAFEGHNTFEVEFVAFSPDGLVLASGGLLSVRLWDVASGQEQVTLVDPKSEGGYWPVAFSPDGLTLAGANAIGDEVVRLWDVASGQEQAVFKGHTGGIGSLAFSPDGQTLAGGSYGPILLWDVAGGQQKAPLDGPYHGGTASVAFSPDGQTLASAAGNETILLWDVASGQQKAAFKDPLLENLDLGRDVESIAFSPDGLILASGRRDGTILLWDVASGQVVAALEGHTAGEAKQDQLRVRSVAFSPAGLILASGSRDKTVRLWDVARGEQKALFEGHTDWVQSVSFSPDGQLLASGGEDGTILLWDTSPYTLPPEVEVSLRAAADTLIEGEAVEVTVRLSRDPKRNLTIPVTGTSHSQGAYSGLPEEVTFTTGQTEHTFVLAALDDEEDERDQRLILGFGPLPERVIPGSPARWVFTLLDDDPPRSHRIQVEARVLGEAVEGLIVEFSRAISGRRRAYAWSGTTGVDGRVALNITTRTRASGFYQARARDSGEGVVVGRWHSIPLNANRHQVLKLPLGGDARVVSVESMAAAKEAPAPVVPKTRALEPNHPNPFNSRTRIAYRLALSGRVRLSIYNTLGKPVRTLVERFQSPGAYQVSWDGRDDRGRPLASGVYLYRLAADQGVETRKLTLLR